MRCVEIKNPGPNSQLILAEKTIPDCLDAEILLQVHATALNHADLLQRKGKYPPPPGTSAIPGLEVAGEVIKTGSKVTQFKAGDRVYALLSGGGYAEYCSAHQNLAHKIPDNWSYELAAAIPEALTTAHATAFELGQLIENESFLIHGAGSGISSTAIQMAKLVGSQVITTIGSEEKRKKAESLGADQIINYKKNPLFEVVHDCSIDVIVDFIGGEYFANHLKTLTHLGRLIQIGCMHGHRVETSLLPIMQKRLSIKGFILRSQSLLEKSLLWQKAHDQWFKYYQDEDIQPVIDSVYVLDDIESAHSRMQSSEHFGKIVIKI